MWPDRWPAQPGDGAQRRDRLRAAFPGLGPEQAAACAAELDQAGTQLPGTLTQDPGSFILPALRRHGLGGGPDQVAAALSAMCLPAASRLRLFPGAAGLLGRLVGVAGVETAEIARISVLQICIRVGKSSAQ